MDKWEEKVSCATRCARCDKDLAPVDERILSVYDNAAICLDCKREEEARPDYEAKAKDMIGQCIVDVERRLGDPGGFCYHHFYPYKCT